MVRDVCLSTSCHSGSLNLSGLLLAVCACSNATTVPVHASARRLCLGVCLSKRPHCASTCVCKLSWLFESGEYVCCKQRRLTDEFDNHLVNMCRFVAQDAASYQYLVESIRRFPDQEAFAAEMERAQFKGVDYENLSGGVVAIHSGLKM